MSLDRNESLYVDIPFKKHTECACNDKINHYRCHMRCDIKDCNNLARTGNTSNYYCYHHASKFNESDYPYELFCKTCLKNCNTDLPYIAQTRRFKMFVQVRRKSEY